MPSYTNQSRVHWSTPHKESSSIFVDQDTPSYTHTQMPYSSHGLVYRPSISNDNSFSLSNMASSLPTASPITDRMLPNPAAGRTSLNYGRSDNFTEGPLRSLSRNLSSSSMIPPQGSTPGSQNVNGQCGNYLPLSSSPDSNPSTTSQLSYSQSVPATTSELYPNEPLYVSDVRHTDSSNYLYSDDSQSSRKDSLGRNSLSGTLSSGQIYTRVPSGASQTYPTRRPSMDLPTQTASAPLRAT